MGFDLDTIQRRIRLLDPNARPPEEEDDGRGPRAYPMMGDPNVPTSTPNAGTSPVGTTPGTMGQPGGGYQSKVLKYNDIQGGNYQNVNDFDFNRQYADQTDQLGRRAADAQSQYDMANQQDEEGYQRYVRGLQDQTGDSFDADSEKFANNGILRSGAAVRSAGDLGQSYQNELDQANRQRTDGKTSREGEYARIQRQIQEQLGGLQEERTRRQQVIEQDRARQAAEAQAAQDAALAAQQATQPYIGDTGTYQLPGGGMGGAQQPTNQRYDIMNAGGTGGRFNAGQATVDALRASGNLGSRQIVAHDVNNIPYGENTQGLDPRSPNAMRRR